jgi:hypothetical protein
VRGEWLDSLAPLEGSGVFTPGERERLKREQRSRGDSRTRHEEEDVARSTISFGELALERTKRR